MSIKVTIKSANDKSKSKDVILRKVLRKINEKSSDL